MTRKEFEMTEEQYQKILKASQPVPYMLGIGGRPLFGTPEENAESAWMDLGAELGFDGHTALPVPGKSDRFFSAEVPDVQ